METITDNFRRNLVVYITFVFVLISRATMYSPWLEDWDSVQYALALDDYSIANHTPHPPGYPVYIATGRIIDIFAKNDVFALTLLSVVAGSGLFFGIFLPGSKNDE